MAPGIKMAGFDLNSNDMSHLVAIGEEESMESLPKSHFSLSSKKNSINAK
tara:strand:+ start:266 stop:415 length:150 start_codon:yes stop_codon:yes gene_type:complete